jgi:hypothetical protein
MTDHRKSSKDPRALFEEIDALCAEIDEATLNAAVESAATIHDVTLTQEARERSKRQYAYAELLACVVLDIEIQPYESPRDRASLLVRSSAGVLAASVEVEECYGLLEFLLARGFAILRASKARVAPRDKRDEEISVTWFLLSKVPPNTSLQQTAFGGG